MCARAYLLIVFDVECHRRNALTPKRAARGSRVYQIWSPGRPPGGAIRCSPLVRERLGLGGWDARPRHGAMRDGFQAPGSTRRASRGVICEFWGAQLRPSVASQVRSNGFPAGSAAVGASPFSPPTPRVRREGRLERADRRELLCGSVRKYVYNGGGWRWPGVPGALAGRPELVVSLQPFAHFWLGGSGEILGGSEGGPEGARGDPGDLR